MKKHIPNSITILNLLCGTTAIVFSLEGNWQWAVVLVLAAALLDFLDGFMARVLKAESETGKQLDSLADIVSFGVVPTVMLYQIYRELFTGELPGIFAQPALQWIILITVLAIPAFSAIRLARFNVQESGTRIFSGLPTPAHTLFWTGIYWQIMKDGLLFETEISIWFLWIIHLVMAFHMIVPIPMISLKFDHFKLRGNFLRYMLILVSLVILIFTGISGLPLIILTYILLSLLNLLLR